MQKFTTLTGIAAHLPMINVDTDMIIPKQYLKTIKRTGLSKGLFADLRYDEKGHAPFPTSSCTSRLTRKRRSSSPAKISAAAPPASMRPGRCSISASLA